MSSTSFSLACRCAKKSKEQGYTYFGLQYYGECHSGENAEYLFDKHGESDYCVQGQFGSCEDPEGEECVGEANANFVYKIKDQGLYSDRREKETVGLK